MSYRAFWQRRCRAAAAGAVLKPSGGNCAVLPKNKMAYMSCIIRFGIKTADQTMGIGGIGTKAKVDMERARAEVGMLLDRQKRGNVM